jgi:hypothetical protein
METVVESSKPKNQQRTAIVYFGQEREDYLCLAAAADSREFLNYIQKPLQAQLGAEKHRVGCTEISRYTGHGKRERYLQGWLGERVTVPIYRVRCCGCGAVFTVLPSFILRYRRQDSDCLSKLLTLSLSMGLSQRHTATIYTWSGLERSWTPGGVWSLLQWLGNLLPVAWLLLRLGLMPPAHVLSDEKFAAVSGERIYLFLISQGELIWSTEWLKQANEAAFEPAITNFLSAINTESQRQEQLPPTPNYQPQTVTTDGWKPVQNAWQSQVSSINLLECRWHGRQRIDRTLKEYAQQHPELTKEELQQLKQKFGHLFAAPSVTAYSQRLRRLHEAYGDDPILSKRLTILKDKQFLFTDYLNFCNASPFLAPLDRSMRFLDEKLQTFGQFWAQEKINATLNAWALINNLRTFLPDAKRAGQSLVEVFGASLKRIPWMEALNLCTVLRIILNEQM